MDIMSEQPLASCMHIGGIFFFTLIGHFQRFQLTAANVAIAELLLNYITHIFGVVLAVLIINHLIKHGSIEIFRKAVIKARRLIFYVCIGCLIRIFFIFRPRCWNFGL